MGEENIDGLRRRWKQNEKEEEVEKEEKLSRGITEGK